MSEDFSYLSQPPITLVCAPELKTRLMLRLADWASDADGRLDPGITVHPGRRDRAEPGTSPGHAYVTIVPGVFARYGDPPFTGYGGQTIDWRLAPCAYFIDESDIAPPADL